MIVSVEDIPSDALAIIASRVAFPDDDERRDGASDLVRVYSLENMARTCRKFRTACADVVNRAESKIVRMIRKYDFASPGRTVKTTDVTAENAGIDPNDHGIGTHGYHVFIPVPGLHTVVFGTLTINDASSSCRFLEFMKAGDAKYRSDVRITSAIVSLGSKDTTGIPQRRVLHSGALDSCIYLHVFKIELLQTEETLFRNMHRLTILRLRDVHITKSLLEALGRHHMAFGSLTVLDIVGVEGYTVQASSKLLLKAFDRTGLEVRVTSTKARSENHGFDEFLSSACSLRRLDLADTLLLSHSPRFHANKFYALESLDLSSNNVVTDISSIARLERLVVLNVDFCTRLDDLAGAGHVKVISARGCPVTSYSNLICAKFLAVGALGSMFRGLSTTRFQDSMRSLLSSIDGLALNFRPTKTPFAVEKRGCLTTMVLSDLGGQELPDHVFLYELAHIHHIVLDSSKVFRGIRSAHPAVTLTSLPTKYLHYESLPSCPRNPRNPRNPGNPRNPRIPIDPKEINHFEIVKTHKNH